MEDNIQKLVNAANSTNAVAQSIGLKKLTEMGLDKNGSPLQKSEPKAKKAAASKSGKEPKPKYKVGDKLNHTDGDDTFKVVIKAVTGYTGNEHRYNVEFLDDNLEPKLKFATSYDKNLSRFKSEPSKNSYDCDDLITKEKDRKKKAKEAAEKRANAPKKTPATKNKEAVEKTTTRVEKSVASRASKGEVSVAEIDKIIAEYEEAIKKLKALRERASGKMAKGGNLSETEMSEIMEGVHGIHKHHCKCQDNK